VGSPQDLGVHHNRKQYAIISVTIHAKWSFFAIDCLLLFKSLVIMNTWDRKTLQLLGQVAKDNQLQKKSI
jgi:hypothetical protein